MHAGNFYMLFCRLLILKKTLYRFQKILSGISSVSNSSDPDQAQHFAGPDMGTNCLQR